MNFKIHRISKDKKVNKLWRKLFDQIRLNTKSSFVWQAHNNKSIHVDEIFNWRVSFKFPCEGVL